MALARDDRRDEGRAAYYGRYQSDAADRAALRAGRAAIAQIRATLHHQNIDSTKNFLLTNRHFRPVRPNPERWFYALPNF